ncbi:septum formation initiator family protein [Conexibacter sp. JD483]|uniref:FtsB family cell division protein n=1 Tax=unclassified Conexibacter TaxID=2627773 RepID=UPI0027183FDD|nr:MULTISPECIES: septum formation initiator family protein [unclassified Conexibacter]MDO8185938.1 septum formation initiator family protein [Conexibacter sp. CPCC 205706]MDO8199429.1 septum formation initiator family protein [Conexibacter sp. CPCC 205762]MDR9368548.1 septum formation initiator family protein [Conexibacter sp. JD483]
MPSAEPPRRDRRRPAQRPPAQTAFGAAAMRVRWDRVGRIALLLLLAGVVALYVQPARSYVSTWRDSNAKQQQVSELQREHDALEARSRSLREPRTVETEARRLGMVRPGERPYVVSGLPEPSDDADNATATP